MVWGPDFTFSNIHIFGLVGFEQKKLQKLREVEAPCLHAPSLCPVEVQGRRLLGVACSNYMDLNVTLNDLSNGEVVDEFKYGDKSGLRPMLLCAGEPGKLWLIRLNDLYGENEFHLIELDCSGMKLKPTGRTLPVAFKRLGSVCYLPAPYNALVTNAGPDVLLSVDCESGERLWELKGDVDGAEINPAGVTFSPQHQLILVSDWKNSRIMALDPSSGSHLQSLPVPKTLGLLSHLRVHNEHVFLLSYVEDGFDEEGESISTHTLSCFSLN